MFGGISACGWRLEPQNAAAQFCFAVRSDEKRAGGGWLHTGATVVPPWLAGDGQPLTGIATAHHRSPLPLSLWYGSWDRVEVS